MSVCLSGCLCVCVHGCHPCSEGYICHSGLGHVHMHSQHFDQAAHHFATALLILEALEGADHPDAIEMHQNLGLCCIPILQTFQKHSPPAVWNSYRLRCLRHFKSALLLQRVWASAENQPLPQLEIIYFYIKAAFISFSQQALGLSGGTTEGVMGGLQRGAAEDQQQAGGLAVMAIPYVHTLAYYMAHMLRHGQHAMQDRAQIRVSKRERERERMDGWTLCCVLCVVCCVCGSLRCVVLPVPRVPSAGVPAV